MSKRTRVRFAPSPTGPLHMGGVRTALYNYLYAKQKGGDFILRIEDTDSNRFVPGAEQYIIEALRWCGIYPDEGVDAAGNVVETPSEQHPHAPYRQSQRRGIYRRYAEQLVASGNAYYAFDTAEELEKARADAEARGETFIYNHLTRGGLRNSLTLSPEEVKRLLEERTDWTVRFRMPEDRVVEMDDLIRGHIEVHTATLDDKVLWKRADELPTYHLANIVDDHLMEITEVIRGEEWLPSLPLHYLLYEAFGWQDSQPRFAHLPLLLKPIGNGKLSKRDGDKMGFPVFPLRWTSPATGETSRGYREDGYFPEAFVNLLAMLGWNPGTEQEIFSLSELVQAFSLDKVGKSGAKFNPEKARWFNREYLRMRSDEELTADFLPLLQEKGIDAVPTFVQGVVALVKERATFVQDFWTIASYLFIAPSQFEAYGVKPGAASEKPADPNRPVDPRAKVYDDAATFPFLAKDVDKFYKPEIYAAALEAMENAAPEALEDYIREHGMPMGKVMNCIRLALSGASSGLGIADILHFIGKEEGIARLRYMKERLG
ncbi:MAG: glutamate--tRNA ligase [Bacteroidales bacterium]|nr:glutamate--tRNA ligase [Bacteroidales bacterium]